MHDSYFWALSSYRNAQSTVGESYVPVLCISTGSDLVWLRFWLAWFGFEKGNFDSNQVNIST
jgi:hypothetical protein